MREGATERDNGEETRMGKSRMLSHRSLEIVAFGKVQTDYDRFLTWDEIRKGDANERG